MFSSASADGQDEIQGVPRFYGAGRAQAPTGTVDRRQGLAGPQQEGRGGRARGGYFPQETGGSDRKQGSDPRIPPQGQAQDARGAQAN
jgi:hypothetical protein